MPTDLNATHCDQCGAPLFHAVPHQTTPEEIVAFARSTTMPGMEQIIKDAWIHPGIYCPNGCTIITLNYGRGPDPNDTNPLVKAAREDRSPGRVRRLLDAGADVNGTDGWRHTALRAAIHAGHQEIVRLLLERGADVHKASSDGDVPIRMASERGRADIVNLLLEYGADINTGLWAAAGAGCGALTTAVLARGADVNAVICNYTVLMKAIAHERLKVVRLLLEHGADVNLKTATGTNALIRAAEQNHPVIVGLLLEHGADVAVKDAKGRTALYFTKRYNFDEVSDLLVQAGASE